MPKANVNGIDIHYMQSGDGPDITLVHGLTGDLSTWYVSFVPQLSKTYRVTSYDLRGHGRSSAPRTGYDTPTMVADLTGLLDHLGVERTFLVGHSYGGILTMAFAWMHPERARGVVIYDTGFPCMRHMHDFENWSGWERYKKEFDSIDISKDQDYRNPYLMIPKLAKAILPIGLRAGKPRQARRMMRLLNETDIFEEARRVEDFPAEALLSVKVPVLGIYGSESAMVAVGRHLAANLPDFELRLVEGEDHFYAVQAPKEFLKLVCEFVARILAREQAPAPEPTP
ncbi:MAG: alpha/beta hydrolase [Candidatus Sumerlaeota bacterium]|nr:alpha/beta hydrolase [Candidatus Sumerlaeota bacterium]